MSDREIIKPRGISGFADYNEPQNVELSRWIQSIEETYRRYGFSRLIPRPLELRSVLLSRGGIQKQVFGVSRLPNDEVTDLALPFDRTVPLAHWVALNATDVVFPYKRYDISYSYRGERAQAGRFRGFFQADIDIIGQDSLDLNADAECIAVLYEALSQLSLGKFRIVLNHMCLAKALLSGLGFIEDQRSALVVIDKLGKIGVSDTAEELASTLNVEIDTARKVVDLFAYDGDVDGFCHLCTVESDIVNRSLDELRMVWKSLESLGVPSTCLTFQPGTVRGLDYYSGIVFETFLLGMESIGSVASGGRYDDLVSTFSALQLPGVGGSIGLTRLFDTACDNKLVDMKARSEAQLFVGFRTPELKGLAQLMAAELRKLGLRTDLYSGSGKIKKQLSYADRKGIPVAVVVMDDASIVVRDMPRQEQKDVPSVDEAIREVEQYLSR